MWSVLVRKPLPAATTKKVETWKGVVLAVFLGTFILCGIGMAFYIENFKVFDPEVEKLMREMGLDQIRDE